MSEAQGRFLTGGTFGHVVRMTATGAVGLTFIFLVDAANLVWLSLLGDQQLVAAIGFAYAVQFFTVSIGVGLMVAATAVVSRSIGAGDRARARRQAGAAVAIAVAVLGVVSVLVIAFRHPLVEMAGAQGETARLAARYLFWSVPSLAAMAAAMVMSGTMRADGYGAKAMYVTLSGGTALMLFDPFLIYYSGWGLDGAAAGLTIFRFTMLGVATYLAVFKLGLVDRPRLRTLRNVLSPFVIVAVPAIATQMSLPVGNYLLTMVMAPFGDDAVAAWAVVGRLTVVVFGGIFALSGAIGGIFGQNYGAGQMDRVRATYRDALLFCLVYTLVAWAGFVLAVPMVAALFGLSAQGAEVLYSFAVVGVGGYIFVGALFVSNAAFNNLGRPMRSTLVNWIKDGVLSMPLALWLAGMFGAAGVIYGQAAAGIVLGAASATWGWFYVKGLRADAPLDPVTDAP